MILLVDIGNTNIKFKLSNGSFFKVPTKSANIYDALTSSLTDEFKCNIEGAIISSVVPYATKTVKDFIKEKYNTNPIDVNLSLNHRVHFLDNKQLGSDIICSCTGASLITDTFILIDLGTATTYTLVKENKFVGTAIAPGVKTSYRALIKDTSLLEDIDFDDNYTLVSDTTEGALKSGLINPTAYSIDGYIKSIKETYSCPNAKVFLTGGMAKVFAQKIKEEVTADRNLIFSGLLDIYNRNK